MLPPVFPVAVDRGFCVEEMAKVAFILEPTAHPPRIAIVQPLAA